eukprot:659401-Amphidinium_carterae.1
MTAQTIAQWAGVWGPQTGWYWGGVNWIFARTNADGLSPRPIQADSLDPEGLRSKLVNQPAWESKLLIGQRKDARHSSLAASTTVILLAFGHRHSAGNPQRKQSVENDFGPHGEMVEPECIVAPESNNTRILE